MVREKSALEESIKAGKAASSQKRIYDFADCAVAARPSADERRNRQNLGMRIGGRGGETGDLHRGQVVYVVAHVADLVESQGAPLGEGTQRRGLVAAAPRYIFKQQLGSVAVDQRTVLARDQSDAQSGAAGQRDAHYVGEAKA